MAVAAAGVIVASIAIAFGFVLFPATENVPQPPPAAAPATVPAPAAPAAPSFDIIRIGPAGDTVIAGRTAPGGTVEILADDVPIGRITADVRGEWVFVPEEPLSPGPHTIGVRAAAEPGSPAPPTGVTTTVTIPGAE